MSVLVAGLAVAATSGNSTASASSAAPISRDPLQWPFAWSSIWNMPRGTASTLVPAGITAATGWGMTVDEDVIVLEPDAPQNNVVVNTAGWDGSQTRCGTVQPASVLIGGVPIPSGFSTDPGYLGTTPNMSAALLLADGETVVQTQPFHRCGAGGLATSQYQFASANLRTGDGIAGAHGGSSMSSLGGTIRLGELVPGGTIRHALKVNLNCAHLCAYANGEADGRNGYRWPALSADSGAAWRYGGTNPALQMGSLLTLAPSFDESTLHSEPARIVARAMRDYGAYVVDDTGWDAYSLATEWSPDGRVVDEFVQTWGFAIDSAPPASCSSSTVECRWAKDMAAIYTSLAVVDDNGPSTVGGAGDRLRPCAPAFTDGTGAAPAACTVAGSPPSSTASTTTSTTAPAPTTPSTPAPPTPPLLPSAGTLKLATGALLSRTVALDGARMTTDTPISVTLAPSAAGAGRIELWLDDPLRAGAPFGTAEQPTSDDAAAGRLPRTVSFVIGRLPAGTHTVTVLRTDAAGERSLSTGTFEVTDAPGTAPVADHGPTPAGDPAPTDPAGGDPAATATTTTSPPSADPPAGGTPPTGPTGPTGDAAGGPAATGATDVLRVGTAADRSGALDLDGAVLSPASAVAVRLDVAAPVSRVSFWLDGGQLDAPARRTETVAPYDFAGGGADGAELLPLRSLRGVHRIVAVARRLDGTEVRTVATFEVR